MSRKVPARTKRHQLVITISTDKPCTKAVALRELRECIHGEFYMAQLSDREPEVFCVRSFKPLPRSR